MVESSKDDSDDEDEAVPVATKRPRQGQASQIQEDSSEEESPAAPPPGKKRGISQVRGPGSHHVVVQMPSPYWQKADLYSGAATERLPSMGCMNGPGAAQQVQP